MLDEGMETCQFGKCLEEVIGNRRARKVVDEPSDARALLHPLEKTDNVALDQVMCEEGTEDDIDGLVRISKDIGSDPMDLACSCSGVGRDVYGVRIEIATCQHYADFMLMCPGFDAPQSVAVSASYVEDAHRRGEPLQFKRLEPVEGGPVAQKAAVDFAEIAEAGFDHFSTAWLVHQLRKVGALAEVERIRRHGRA